LQIFTSKFMTVIIGRSTLLKVVWMLQLIKRSKTHEFSTLRREPDLMVYCPPN